MKLHSTFIKFRTKQGKEKAVQILDNEKPGIPLQGHTHKHLFFFREKDAKAACDFLREWEQTNHQAIDEGERHG